MASWLREGEEEEKAEAIEPYVLLLGGHAGLAVADIRPVDDSAVMTFSSERAVRWWMHRGCHLLGRLSAKAAVSQLSHRKQQS